MKKRKRRMPKRIHIGALPDHDYDPSWDYELTTPTENLYDAANEAMGEVEDIFEATDRFEGATIVFAKNTGRLGRYASGTKSNPVIILDVKIEKLAEEKDVPLWDAVCGTVLHELAHAILEIDGLDIRNEEYPEDFAREWIENMRFLEPS